MDRRIAGMLFFLVCTACYMASCRQSAEKQAVQESAPGQGALATLDGVVITQEAFAREMARRGGHVPGRFETLQQKEALLEEMLQFALLVHQAKKAGYDQDAEIVDTLHKMMAQKFLHHHLESRFAALEITDEEITQYYQSHLDEYRQPEMARAAVIYLRTPTKNVPPEGLDVQQKAATVLQAAREQRQAEPSFGQLATMYSDDNATKHRGGDIGWVSKGAEIYKWDTAIIDAIFALKNVGDVSPLIQAPQGVYLVKLMEKKAATAQGLEQVKDDIRQRLLVDKKRQIQNDYVYSLKKDVPITINTALLEQVAISRRTAESGGQPPQFPMQIKTP